MNVEILLENYLYTSGVYEVYTPQVYEYCFPRERALNRLLMTTTIPPNEEEGAIGDAIDRGRNEVRRLWRRPVCLSPGVRVRVCLGARCDGHPGRPLIGGGWLDG